LLEFIWEIVNQVEVKVKGGAVFDEGAGDRFAEELRWAAGTPL